jgi:threonine aldolase
MHLLIRHTSVKQTAQPFSSVYISFYKGLGNGIGGAMLLGSADFCKEARVWLRRFGGNLYSVLPYTIASWAGWQRNCLQSEDGASTEAFHQRQKKLARILELLQSDSTISSTVIFDPAIPETNMVHGYTKVSYDECVAALKASEEQSGIRVLSRLRRCEFGCRFEWVMGESNFVIEDAIFVTGWNAFAKACVRGNK